ncbi:MAG: hypothetical protein JKY93_00970 [Gammaproteobacteria bacterium]|nr:hypothetical protein [Gammaproteobacteria bacterium]
MSENNVIAIGNDFQLIVTSTVNTSSREQIVLTLQDANKDLDFMIRLRDEEIERMQQQKLTNIEMMEVLTCQTQ